MPVDPETERRWRSYFIDGTDDVLKNRLGITDRLDLEDVEYAVAAVRAYEIKAGIIEIPRTFDETHIRALHGELFGDVYEWAGDLRDVPLIKGSSRFTAPDEIPKRLAELHDVIVSRQWDGLDSAGAATALAGVYAGWNACHPFREGNGRATRLFMADVARHGGYLFAEEDVRRGELIDAARQSFLGHREEVRDLFARHIRPLTDADAIRPVDGRSRVSHDQIRAAFGVDVEAGETLSARVDAMISRRDAALTPLRDAAPSLSKVGIRLQ